MNLAEIRKKAVEARKQDDSELFHPSAGRREESFDDFADDSDMTGSVVSEFSGDDGFVDEEFTEADSKELAEFDLGDMTYEQLMAEEEFAVEAPAVIGDEFGEMPAETITGPVEEAMPAVADAAVIAAATPVTPVSVRHPAYDPLATLLAGRQAAAGGEEVPTDEGQIQFSDNVEEYLCFKVAHEEYALNIMDIKEIIKPREVTEVPRMPKFVSGVISLRGVIIPIMDMRLRLSLPVGASTGRERILVLRTSDGYCGVLVDEVIQVVKITSSSIEGPPTILDGIDKEFVKGLGRFDNRMLILLNLDSILDLEIR